MKIGVVGAGVSGLVAAYVLADHHDVTLFEQHPRPGGHTNTLCVRHEGRDLDVDTGFIVFNDRNYPNFTRLLSRLGVGARDTTMSFSVRDGTFEYGGESLAGVVGSPRNLLSPRWWRVLTGVLTLGTRGKRLLAQAGEDVTLGDLVARGDFSRGFAHDYLVPMAAAIWSAPRAAMLEFPARFFLRFFDHHGMLDLRERPQWRTVAGGSHAYVRRIVQHLGPRVRAACPVRSIRREPDSVLLQGDGWSERFDHVILATHADEALALLADQTDAERELLGAMPFQANETVLHWDASVLPRRRRCWAAWNYALGADPLAPVAVTYNMSILQGFETREPLCVTLNDSKRIDPAKTLARMTYHHPIYTVAGERARARWGEISGPARTHFCGAYWLNGFHEDGVRSALRVCERFGGVL